MIGSSGSDTLQSPLRLSPKAVYAMRSTMALTAGFNAKVLHPMKAGFNKLIAHGVPLQTLRHALAIALKGFHQ
jgi:hypothetical protein